MHVRSVEFCDNPTQSGDALRSHYGGAFQGEDFSMEYSKPLDEGSF
jgi:hypothetical protein